MVILRPSCNEMTGLKPKTDFALELLAQIQISSRIGLNFE